jgi:hypothetical protein
MSKSLELFKYFVMLTPEPHPVVKLYALTTKKDAKVTKYDVYHLLVILKRSHLISRNKHKGGLLIPLPQLFFNLSYTYARSPRVDPEAFIKSWLRRENISWCYNDLMNFIENYGDIISLFFTVVDSIYSKSELSFRAATLLYIASDVVPEPYSYIVPNIKSSLFERIELSKKALSKIYSLIKDRISSLTSEYKNPVYINARNIASAIFFYVLLIEGVKRILYYPSSDTPDPHLALLFSLNERFTEYANNWRKYLLNV